MMRAVQHTTTGRSRTWCWLACFALALACSEGTAPSGNPQEQTPTDTTDDGGGTPQPPPAPTGIRWAEAYPHARGSVLSIWAADAEHVFAVGGQVQSRVNFKFGAGGAGFILQSDGDVWSRVDLNVPEILWAVWGSSATDVWAIGSGKSYHYDGVSWRQASIPTTFVPTDIWGTASDNIYVVTADGGIWRYDGAEWNNDFSAGLSALYGIWGTSPSNIFAVGQGGTIRHYDGTGWRTMASSTTAHLYAVWGSSATDVYAAGQGATVVHYDGTSWSKVQLPYLGDPAAAELTFYSVGGTSAEDVRVTTPYRHLRFDGTRWINTANDTPPERDLIANGGYEVWGDPAVGLFAAWRTNGVIVQRDPEGWHYSHAGLRFARIWALSADNAVATTKDGTGPIMHFDGEHWRPLRIENTPGGWAVWGRDDSWLFVSEDRMLRYQAGVWTSQEAALEGPLHAIHGRSLNELYGMSGNTLYRFDGTSWTPVKDVTRGIHAIRVTGPDTIYAVGDTLLRGAGGTWEGMSWGDIHSSSRPILRLWGPSSNFLLGTLGTVWLAHYDGVRWQQIRAPSFDVHGVGGTSTSDIFVVGESGGIAHRTGTGTGWQTLESITPYALHDVFATERRVFAVGEAGTILHGDR